MKGKPMKMCYKEETLFGHPRYEVESLADTIMRARESESLKPELYNATIKLLEHRQKVLSAVLVGAINKRRSKNNG